MEPGPAQAEQPPAPTIADVIAEMETISTTLPAGDGVRAFNDMYLETTRQVGQAVSEQGFADAGFIDRLDVRFAQLYFGALSAHGRDPDSAPRCWAALFDARARPGTHPLQFAVAGMNAHITYDLPRALVMTVEEFGGDLDDGARRSDFVAINEVLARTQPIIKDRLLSGAFADLDDTLGDLDDRVGMWAIEAAREMAWGSAQALWALRGSASAPRFTWVLDRAVATSSRMMLGL
jgi:hypothetical protein